MFARPDPRPIADVSSTDAPRAVPPHDEQPSVLRSLVTAVRMLCASSLLFGIAYPLVVTGVAKVAFAERARGSLIEDASGSRGSLLIGQNFEQPRYFWGRPSATSAVPYDGAASTGSNLGPTNEALTRAATARIDALRAADPGNIALVPVDLVTSSGSGLDPHISPAAAAYQLDRVARARGISVERVRQLVAASTEPRTWGIFGEARVNVLVLNLRLDRGS